MSKRSVISLYTGAGGLDLGFEAAGFEVACAVEMDGEAVETLRRNRDWTVIHRDIHQVPSAEILAEGHLQPGDADVLIGGPPCQPFSKSGYWANGDTMRLDDPRAGTMAAYLRVLRDTLPATFFLENVPGLAYRGKSEGIELIERTVAQVNREHGVQYSLRVTQLNAADYGVPQMRERVIVVGSRDGRLFDFPQPTHGEIEGAPELCTLEPYKTAWDAIGDIEDDDTGARAPRQVGGAAALDSRGRELPLAHGPGRRRAALRLAAALLELPPEARQEPAVVDDPGPAGAGGGALPLEEPQALGPRAVPAADLPRRLSHQRRHLCSSASAGQRGTGGARGGGGTGDAAPAPRR